MQRDKAIIVFFTAAIQFTTKATDTIATTTVRVPNAAPKTWTLPLDCWWPCSSSAVHSSSEVHEIPRYFIACLNVFNVMLVYKSITTIIFIIISSSSSSSNTQKSYKRPRSNSSRDTTGFEHTVPFYLKSRPRRVKLPCFKNLSLFLIWPIRVDKNK